MKKWDNKLGKQGTNNLQWLYKLSRCWLNILWLNIILFGQLFSLSILKVFIFNFLSFSLLYFSYIRKLLPCWGACQNLSSQQWDVIYSNLFSIILKKIVTDTCMTHTIKICRSVKVFQFTANLKKNCFVRVPVSLFCMTFFKLLAKEHYKLYLNTKKRKFLSIFCAMGNNHNICICTMM